MIAESRDELRPVDSGSAGGEGSARRGDVSAAVLEVFASLQGEGLYAGEPQTFVRLRGCPLRCGYCDTPESWTLRASSGRWPRNDSDEPVRATAFQVLCWVRSAEGAHPRTISVTGGEPLLWPDFLLELARLAGNRRIHLETAGAHPDALARVADSMHHLSLDLKLASTLAAPVELEGHADEPSPRTSAEWSAVRARTLALARGRDACGKIVLVAGFDPDELQELLDDVLRLAPELPVILQPATPVRAAGRPSAAELGHAVELALERGLVVRVLPQIHRALGVP